MGAAGIKGGLYNKYKDRGLRVIAFSYYGITDGRFLQKWKDAGAEYSIYGKKGNVFWPIVFHNVKNFPSHIYIKDGQKVGSGSGSKSAVGYENDMKRLFGF